MEWSGSQTTKNSISLGKIGDDPSYMAFWQLVSEKGLQIVTQTSKFSGRLFDANLQSDLHGADLTDYFGDTFKTLVVWMEEYDCLVYMYGPAKTKGSFEFIYRIAGHSEDKVSRTVQFIDSLLPLYEIEDPGKAPITFWALNPHGVTKYRKEMNVPTWADIKVNYSFGTQLALSSLMDLSPPLTSGQLIVLHGIPGTGKTWTIRAMSRSWKSWCNFHYVLDPERFFEHAHYMLDILLDAHEQPSTPSTLGQLEEQDKWMALIIEDSDEFLTVDAKARSGQALSRLLNLTEGFIGQGLKLLVIMTTNEPFSKLHPAVSRPGRCLANIEFGKFTSEESAEWLEKRNCLTLPVGASTLGELYERIKDQKIIQSKKTVLVGLR